MSKPQIIICDIDGVLANESSRRINHLMLDPKDYDGYYKDVSQDPHIPILWNLLKWEKVFLLTGRRESCRKQTLQWLDRRPYLKADNSHLLMRKDWDFRPAFMLKEEMALELMKDYDIKLAIDDNEEICSSYNALGIPTLLCNFYDLAQKAWN